MPELIVMKLGMYVMTHESISVAHSIHPSRKSVCLYVYAARHRLGNEYASFSVRYVLYQRKVCGSASVSVYRC
jgi:hypothetical protein